MSLAEIIIVTAGTLADNLTKSYQQQKQLNSRDNYLASSDSLNMVLSFYMDFNVSKLTDCSGYFCQLLVLGGRWVGSNLVIWSISTVGKIL